MSCVDIDRYGWDAELKFCLKPSMLRGVNHVLPFDFSVLCKTFDAPLPAETLHLPGRTYAELI